MENNNRKEIIFHDYNVNNGIAIMPINWIEPINIGRHIFYPSSFIIIENSMAYLYIHKFITSINIIYEFHPNLLSLFYKNNIMYPQMEHILKFFRKNVKPGETLRIDINNFNLENIGTIVKPVIKYNYTITYDTPYNNYIIAYNPPINNNKNNNYGNRQNNRTRKANMTANTSNFNNRSSNRNTNRNTNRSKKIRGSRNSRNNRNNRNNSLGTGHIIAGNALGLNNSQTNYELLMTPSN